MQSHTVEEIFSSKICLFPRALNAVTWVCGLRLSHTVSAGEEIIPCCVTLHLVAFCLTKEIEQRAWRLRHYLLCLVKEPHLICPHADR